ncbi:MAG TPA: radical SAM protein [Gemmatimonadaceae bacterium]|nr:radical SAM protein [Gemmatimonadaceae bacterium]
MSDRWPLEQKLEVLMSMAMDDRDGPPSAPSSRPPRLRNTKNVGALRPLNIRTVQSGPRTRSTLLRVLMTNACTFNCFYCPMRRDRSLPRTLLKPEELVRIFLGALRRGWCSGLFVTTGIPGRPVKVLDDLIEALELLRLRHLFRGYIHVKLVPGGEAAQIERITQLSSRVSLNLETPCGVSLEQIAPEKKFDVTLGDLERVRRLVMGARAEEASGRPRDSLQPGGTAGLTMQFVVGATPDSDKTILDRVNELYAGGGIHHAHFSAFRPIRETPMESQRAAPPLREHRLYQADHLVRRYGYAASEVVYDEAGNLPLAMDPKTAWAITHPDSFPVEVRTASHKRLLRVPGIGPESARRIVDTRRDTIIRGLVDLGRLGVVTSRAAGFLTIDGRRLQTVRWEQQLGFWTPDEEAGAYQLVYDVSPGTFR